MKPAKHHPILFFFVLAFLLSWYAWLIRLAGAGNPGGLNPLGPLIAALIAAGVSQGRAGLKQLLGGLVRWRVSVVWYLVALLLPVAISALAAIINIGLGATPAKALALGDWRGMVDRFIFVFLFIGLGEETGWRGFALPRLQKRHSALAASLILGTIWAVWHAPLVPSELKPEFLPAFALGIVPGAIVHTWLYNRTKGSVLLQMIMHTSLNTFSAGYIFPMFTGAGLQQLWWLFALTWLVTAVVVICVEGKELGRKFDQTADPAGLSQHN